jgi:hypothetical protein
MLFLAAMPLATSAAQGQDKGKDVCALPEGGARRGPPAAARDRALNNGNGRKVGLTRDGNGCVVVEPPAPLPPGDPLPPPTSETAAIQGTAFGDLDVSFTRSAGETGLAGWTITLSGPVSASTVTDVDGNYSFIGLLPGTYVICEEPQLGWWQSAPMVDVGCASGMGGYTRVVSPDAPGVIFQGNDFGNVPIL